MIIHNRTVFEIPLTWNRMQFESTRNKYQVARRLIKFSINGIDDFNFVRSNTLFF